MWRRRLCGVSSLATVFAPLVYVTLLFHWQTLSSVFQRGVNPPLVFLDKLCINQEDEAMKHQGILGLAAFLKNSKRMVMLWSPRYFTRLWCTYELASWLRLGKEAADIVLMPVSVPKYLLAGTGVLQLIVFSDIILSYMDISVAATSDQSSSVLEFYSAYLLFALALAAVGTYAFQEIQTELEHLGAQLAKFSLLAAECFCCTHAHKHPETHAPLL
eukprot:TRINITY_DN36713_c1_g1_i1.p2 TRINITY_DN36713_c1_g1~~TRINITY_DN36713_c1_g1_i1.p2  ORF type:complete len:216 (+),score=16.62 TRINITY_DN36713_c1_g1_i1:243-890(+)